MITIPLSRVGSHQQFAAAVQAHRQALTDYLAGQPGLPIPIAGYDVESVIQRVPREGDPATRGPDRFVILDYEIIDDTVPEYQTQPAA